MEEVRRHIGWLVALVALVLLTAGCSGEQDDSSADSADGLRLDVVEQAWAEETMNVTRSGETLEGLRAVADPAHPADGEGFGIYCSELSISNTQVTWDNANGKWQIGGDYNTYWRRNQTDALNIYAYAPYNASAYMIPADGKLTYQAGHHSYKYVDAGVVKADYTNLLSGENVDLLYASQTGYARNSSESAVLTFKHALAKMTFGTITNNTGGTLSIIGFTIRGILYDSATLDLATGEWSEHNIYSVGDPGNDAEEIKTPPPFIFTTDDPSASIPAGYAGKIVMTPMEDKQTVVPNMRSRELSFIPRPDGKLPLTIEVNSSIANETFSFSIELEQGKNKTYNITLEKNFEVVIKED